VHSQTHSRHYRYFSPSSSIDLPGAFFFFFFVLSFSAHDGAEEANITLTDQKPLLPLIKQNMAHNVENIPQLARVAVEEYNWGEETAMKDINLIICSDCVYDMAPWDLLVDSLRLLCSSGDECRVIISMEHRYRSTEEKFFNYASQHFDIHTIPRVRFTASSSSFFVLLCARKRQAGS
jgi:predicted nicotinamide N-methyase